MESIAKFLIAIIEAIREWISGKKEKTKLQKEKTEEAEKNLHEAVESGTLADLQKAAIDFKKAKQ